MRCIYCGKSDDDVFRVELANGDPSNGEVADDCTCRGDRPLAATSLERELIKTKRLVEELEDQIDALANHNDQLLRLLDYDVGEHVDELEAG